MIAIPGDMPERCADCRFCGAFWWCELLDLDLNPVEGWSDWDKHRHPDCPLRRVVQKQVPIWKGGIE